MEARQAGREASGGRKKGLRVSASSLRGSPVSALKVKMCQRNRRKISTLTPNSIPKENREKTIVG